MAVKNKNAPKAKKATSFLTKDENGVGYFYSSPYGDSRIYFDHISKTVDIGGVFTLDQIEQFLQEANSLVTVTPEADNAPSEDDTAPVEKGE